MTRATLERTSAAEQAGARSERLRSGAVRTSSGADRAVGVPTARRGSRWAVAGGVRAVLTAAVWSLTAVTGAVSPAGPDELGLVGGVVHVDRVTSAAPPQQAMPGMGTDDDPVAEGSRRVSFDVTLRADEDATLEYAASRFRLAAEGNAAAAPKKLVLPGEEIPPGTSLSGVLVFEVPEDATTATLSYGDSRTPVVLPGEAEGDAPAAAPSAAPSNAPHTDGHG